MGALFLTDFGPITEGDAGGASTAADVAYAGGPGLAATDVESAIDELAGYTFSPILTIPSEDTVNETDPSTLVYPDTGQIIMYGYGDAVSFAATAAYPETPRIVGNEGSYIEYYCPPVEVGPGELWEFGIQLGFDYGAGPAGFVNVLYLPITLDADDQIESYQYKVGVDEIQNGGFLLDNGSAALWPGVMTAHILTTAADHKALFGVAMWHGGTGSGIITYYGGSTYARRLA
jgi:hypothetical protein